MRHTIRNAADIDALAEAWGLPTAAEIADLGRRLEDARKAVAALLPADWRVVAAPFDIDAAGFGITLPNGRRHAVRTREIPEDAALIGEVAAKLREWGEAHIADPPP